MEASPDRVAVDLVRDLESAGLACAIGGAIAYGFWGTPRATVDVDLSVFVEEDRYEYLLDVLEHSGCRTERSKNLRQARDGEAMVVWKAGFRVDVFVPSLPFHDEMRRTIRKAPLLGVEVPILSAESTCVLKMLFFRDKDLIDLRHVVKNQGRALDRAYVRRWLVDMVGEDNERIAAWDRMVAEFGSPPTPPA